MLKRKYKNLLLVCGYLLSIGAIVACIGLLVNGVNKYLSSNIEYDYGLYNVFDKLQVVNEEVDTSIIKPFISEEVKISKYFYDYEADKEEQENALVYYENTYMQNSGIDYASTVPFDIIAILEGEVKVVKEDELLGKIVQIKHDKDIISVYQGIDNVSVKEGDKVHQGMIIATSGKNVLNNEENQLHFEIYFKGEIIDPENIYNLNIEDFN